MTENVGLERAPSLPYAKVFTLAASLLVVAVAIIEFGCRARGFQPQPIDGARLWSMWRDSVSDRDDVVVLLGSSRSQLGLDPVAIERVLHGYTVVQLAISGGCSVPVLESLAADPGFRGVVVCEILPRAFFVSPNGLHRQAVAWVTSHERNSWVDPVESELRLRLQTSLVVSRPELRPQTVVKDLLAGRGLPSPSGIVVRGDRFRALGAAYSPAKKPMPEFAITLQGDALLAHFRHVDQLVESIEQRGGRVVFLRMLSDGEARAQERERAPRHEFWDAFVKQTSALAIHYEDFAGLRSHTTVDGDHLRATSAWEFSRVFAELLREFGAVAVGETRRSK